MIIWQNSVYCNSYFEMLYTFFISVYPCEPPHFICIRIWGEKETATKSILHIFWSGNTHSCMYFNSFFGLNRSKI